MIKTVKILFRVLVLILILNSCASMKTSKEQFVGMEKYLKAQDYKALIQKLENTKDTHYKKKDRVIYYLDLGMLYHYDRQFEKSNQMLDKAERAIDELFTKSISKAATSLLLNDNAMDYSGEDYEDIYLNIFKALNYVERGNFDAAFVEVRRVNNKLSLLEQKHGDMAAKFNLSKDKNKEFKTGKNKFHNSALGRYLSMLIYRLEGKMDDARIDKEKIIEAWKLQSHLYDFPKPDIKDALRSTDKIKVNFFSFTGRAPDKKANTLYIHTEKDLIVIGTTKENPRNKQELETLDVMNWKGVEKGYHFKFQMPVMKRQKSMIGKVEVVIDDEKKIAFRTIESLENVALETFEVKKPLIYLKTITRSIAKGLLAEKGKAKMEEQIGNPLLGFAARLAADAAVDATENADLRVSRFFPAEAQIAEIELDPGLHHFKIIYYSRNGNQLHIDDLGEKNVTKDGINIFESAYLN